MGRAPNTAQEKGRTSFLGSEQVVELVAQVAGSGRRRLIGITLLVPIGPAPARAVVALRRNTPEVELVAGLAHGVAAAFQRLLSARP